MNNATICQVARATINRTHTVHICAIVKSRYIGDGHPTFNRNHYNGYINPYYWVDDHPLLYGNDWSLDPGTYNLHVWYIHLTLVFQIPVQVWPFKGRFLGSNYFQTQGEWKPRVKLKWLILYL